jgi:membrane-bound inhibitor of C-type lysozyme
MPPIDLSRNARLAILCAVTTTLACSPEQADEAPAERVEPASTFVYECDDGYGFVARIQGETAWVFLPETTAALPHVTAASGARYSEGSITYWSKGEEALLEVRSAEHLTCANNRRSAVWEHAKLNGADFRAVGNEPGWLLEIYPRRMVLVTDYGENRYEFETPDPVENPEERRTTYEAADRGIRVLVVLEGRECRDTMSDEVFETTVAVRLNEATYRGCGRPLH